MPLRVGERRRADDALARLTCCNSSVSADHVHACMHAAAVCCGGRLTHCVLRCCWCAPVPPARPTPASHAAAAPEQLADRSRQTRERAAAGLHRTPPPICLDPSASCPRNPLQIERVHVAGAADCFPPSCCATCRICLFSRSGPSLPLVSALAHLTTTRHARPVARPLATRVHSNKLQASQASTRPLSDGPFGQSVDAS